MTKHTDNSRIPMYKSKRARKGSLQETNKSNPVHQDTKKLMLNIEHNDNPKSWVDSSYFIHPDMKSHTGIYMKIGNCATARGKKNS